MVPPMDQSVEALERRIERLRVAVREAVLAGYREHARALRAELGQAERAWDDALEQAAAEAAPTLSGPSPRPRPSRTPSPLRVPLLPLREQVHQALSLLTVPAAPRLIATVHEAFFAAHVPHRPADQHAHATRSARSGPRRSPGPTTSAPR